MDQFILDIATNIPIVAFALWVYHRESGRVDKKDEVILQLSKETTAGIVKVSDNLGDLARSINKLDESIEAILRHHPKEE